MKKIHLLFACIILVACGSAPSESDIQTAIAETQAAQPTRAATASPTATPTQTQSPTITTRPTSKSTPTNTGTRPVIRSIRVTATLRPTRTPTLPWTPSRTPTRWPTRTPRPTLTPSLTPTQTAKSTLAVNLAQTATIEALGILTAPRGDGFYTVGVEILPGKWHSTGTGSGCYWARLDKNQNLLDNHFGTGGGTITIRETDFEVELDDCGRWFFVEGAERELLPDATDPKGDGFYTVGVEIASGTWTSTGTGGSCYWVRLDNKQNILDNHYGNAGGNVRIRATDYEVEFSDCGMWEYLEP